MAHQALSRAALTSALALLLAVGLCGCGGEAPERDSVRFPIASDPADLSFCGARDVYSLALTELIGDSLVTHNADLELVPRIAASWEWTDDNRVLVFHLRDDVRWHDGTPVTSADVAHTVRVLQDPKLGLSTRAAGFEPVTLVETPDPLTARIHYDEGFSPALGAWSAPLMPAHRPVDDERLVGCGPFIFDRWETGERIVLRANPDHFSDPPAISGLEFEVIGDYSTRFAALKAGRIDMVGLLPSQHEQLLADEDLRARYALEDYRVLYFWFLAWNQDPDPEGDSRFADPRVRRALTMAIDRQGVLDRFYSGRGSVAVTSFHPDTWAYDPAIEPWPYDPQRARGLLREAGCLDADEDGVLECGGREMRFPLTYSTSSAEIEKIATVVQAELGEVGVVVELEPLEWAVFLERIRGRDFQAMMNGWRLDPDPDPYDIWHSSQADPGGANYSGLRDAQIDGWIDRGRKSFDRDERARVYRLIQRRLHELQPYTFFFYPQSTLAYDQRIDGVVLSPLGPIRFSPGPSAWRWSEQPAAGGGR